MERRQVSLHLPAYIEIQLHCSVVGHCYSKFKTRVSCTIWNFATCPLLAQLSKHFRNAKYGGENARRLFYKFGMAAFACFFSEWQHW